MWTLTRLKAKWPFSLSLLFAASLAHGAVSWAAEGESGTATPDLPAMSTMDSLQMIGKVILFLILIIALFFVLIRFLGRRNQSSFFGKPIRSLGGVPLGQNKSIQVVEIGHSLLIVGVGDNIQLLDKINDAEEVAYVTALLTVDDGEANGLLTMGKWLGKLSQRKKDVEEDVEITSSFQNVFRDKLNKVSNRNKNVEQWLADQNQKDRLNDE
uniref:Flagellar protein n=1 Tax=Paenibacillus athensensis TaxID=1967502 RepID=A0A4Y8QB69_9BACL